MSWQGLPSDVLRDPHYWQESLLLLCVVLVCHQIPTCVSVIQWMYCGAAYQCWSGTPISRAACVASLAAAAAAKDLYALRSALDQMAVAFLPATACAADCAIQKEA